MLSVISQPQKDKYCLIPLELASQIDRENGGRQGLEGGRTGSCCLTGAESQFCKMMKALEMGGSDNCAAGGTYLMPLSCTLKNG